MLALRLTCSMKEVFLSFDACSQNSRCFRWFFVVLRKDDSSHEFDACSQTHLFDDLYSSRVLMLALKTLVVFDEIRRRVLMLALKTRFFR